MAADPLPTEPLHGFQHALLTSPEEAEVVRDVAGHQRDQPAEPPPPVIQERREPAQYRMGRGQSW